MMQPSSEDSIWRSISPTIPTLWFWHMVWNPLEESGEKAAYSWLICCFPVLCLSTITLQMKSKDLIRSGFNGFPRTFHRHLVRKPIIWNLPQGCVIMIWLGKELLCFYGKVPLPRNRNVSNSLYANTLWVVQSYESNWREKTLRQEIKRG